MGRHTTLSDRHRFQPFDPERDTCERCGTHKLITELRTNFSSQVWPRQCHRVCRDEKACRRARR